MPLELKETRLPGGGVKWVMTPAAGSRVTVIQHNDGDREVYVHRRARDEEPAVVLELHDDEARQLGAILGGAHERAKLRTAPSSGPPTSARRSWRSSRWHSASSRSSGSGCRTGAGCTAGRYASARSGRAPGGRHQRD